MLGMFSDSIFLATGSSYRNTPGHTSIKYAYYMPLLNIIRGSITVSIPVVEIIA